MAIRFDDDALNVGDTLYDVVYGTCVVLRITPDNRIHVRFGSGRDRAYSALGVTRDVGREKTLFWHPPIVVTPRKSETEWLKYREMAIAIANTQFGRV
jgi:hypothetical protein